MKSYTWKTTELEQQKMDYSGQKRRPLKKLHLWVSTRGWILFVNGLINGRDNDAKIVREELAKGSCIIYFRLLYLHFPSENSIRDFLVGFKNKFNKNCLILADRGYRLKIRCVFMILI